MEINKNDKCIYVNADIGKILEYDGDKFYCAYMPVSTDISAINEIEDPGDDLNDSTADASQE